MLDDNTLGLVMISFCDDGLVVVNKMTTYPKTKMPKDIFALVPELSTSIQAVYKLTFKGYWVAYMTYLKYPKFYESRKVRET